MQVQRSPHSRKAASATIDGLLATLSDVQLLRAKLLLANAPLNKPSRVVEEQQTTTLALAPTVIVCASDVLLNMIDPAHCNGEQHTACDYYCGMGYSKDVSEYAHRKM